MMAGGETHRPWLETDPGPLPVFEVRLDAVPEFDAAGDGPFRRARCLLPTALVLPGQRNQHISRPGAVAVAVQFNMPFQVVAKYGTSTAPSCQSLSSRSNISGITSSRPKKK
jgi:hypothetical protein